jgi:steroid 5-alpha reductase family enzyme
MDIVYGPLFLGAGLATASLLKSASWLSLLILGAVTLWSLRLFWRIYRKNQGQPEDPRYAAWRTAWQARGQLYFLVRSYLQVNLLQGIVIIAVALPIIISLSVSGISFTNLSLLTYSVPLGLLIFAIGLGIETVADWQLDRFIARKRADTETATLMTTGLFRYSRRPNYFGETLIWWGLAVMVLPLPFGYLALISPLTITYIVTKVTGPMLEKLFLERYPEEYRAYQARTSYFIPLPPKH